MSGICIRYFPFNRTSILNHAKPVTVKDMLSFLGLTGYSRHYIPDYSGLTIPLRHLVKQQGMRNLRAHLQWIQEAEEAFISLKQLVTRATDLALPDYTLTFYLDISETEGSVHGILFQKKGGTRHILMYSSIYLDSTDRRHPRCTQHATGVTEIIQKTAHIVMGHPLHVLTSHKSQIFTMTSLKHQRVRS